MIQALSILFACQLVGEGLVHVGALPVPGPVVGLVVLAGGLFWWERRRPKSQPTAPASLTAAANGLLGHLSLLFVPAAVGIVQQGAAILANGLVIAVSLVASTVLTLAVTAGVFVWATRFVRPERTAP